jgi:hypothetical protein
MYEASCDVQGMTCTVQVLVCCITYANPMPGGITGLPCSWGKYKQEPGPRGWGILKNTDNKICSRVPWDSDLRKAALAVTSKKLIIADPTSR